VRDEAAGGVPEMTRAELNHQVARIAGEPLSQIVALGFSPVCCRDEGHEPEDIRLVLACPFCGRPVAYLRLASDGSEASAECDRCDVYFGFDPDEIYPLPAPQAIGLVGS
jgi:hypothetical protein